MISHACTIENPEERKCFIEMIAIQMKKNYVAWNKDGVDDKKIFEDLRTYTNGAIDITDGEIRTGNGQQHNNAQRNNRNNAKKNNNNGKNNHKRKF